MSLPPSLQDERVERAMRTFYETGAAMQPTPQPTWDTVWAEMSDRERATMRASMLAALSSPSQQLVDQGGGEGKQGVRAISDFVGTGATQASPEAAGASSPCGECHAIAGSQE